MISEEFKKYLNNELYKYDKFQLISAKAETDNVYIRSAIQEIDVYEKKVNKIPVHADLIMVDRDLGIEFLRKFIEIESKENIEKHFKDIAGLMASYWDVYVMYVSIVEDIKDEDARSHFSVVYAKDLIRDLKQHPSDAVYQVRNKIRFIKEKSKNPNKVLNDFLSDAKQLFVGNEYVVQLIVENVKKYDLEINKELNSSLLEIIKGGRLEIKGDVGKFMVCNFDIKDQRNLIDNNFDTLESVGKMLSEVGRAIAKKMDYQILEKFGNYEIIKGDAKFDYNIVFLSKEEVNEKFLREIYTDIIKYCKEKELSGLNDLESVVDVFINKEKINNLMLEQTKKNRRKL